MTGPEPLAQTFKFVRRVQLNVPTHIRTYITYIFLFSPSGSFLPFPFPSSKDLPAIGGLLFLLIVLTYTLPFFPSVLLPPPPCDQSRLLLRMISGPVFLFAKDLSFLLVKNLAISDSSLLTYLVSLFCLKIYLASATLSLLLLKTRVPSFFAKLIPSSRRISLFFCFNLHLILLRSRFFVLNLVSFSPSNFPLVLRKSFVFVLNFVLHLLLNQLNGASF